MKKIILVLLVFLTFGVVAQPVCDICVTSSIPPIEEPRALIYQSESFTNCGPDLSICVNQTYTFSTTEITGAIYGWSIIGNAQIIGPRDQSTVTVVASQTGTFQICLVKSVNGQPNCCICKTVTVNNCGPGYFPFCPLKIVIDGSMSDVGQWDENCGCVWNQVRFNVVCANGTTTTLNNWLSTNNITGNVKWEITSGNFLFSTPLSPCSSDACGVRCDLRNNISHPTWLVSGKICQCSNLPYWNNMVVKATIQLNQGSTVYNIVLQQQIHFNQISSGCGSNKVGTKNLKLYPNPMNENLNLEFLSDKDRKISVGLYNVDGTPFKILAKDSHFNAGQNYRKINISGIKPAMYRLVLLENGIIIQSENLLIGK